MAAHEGEMKLEGQSGFSSAESNANPEDGLNVDSSAVVYGDTEADLADMQRLGKKQDFKVWRQKLPERHATKIYAEKF